MEVCCVWHLASAALSFLNDGGVGRSRADTGKNGDWEDLPLNGRIVLWGNEKAAHSPWAQCWVKLIAATWPILLHPMYVVSLFADAMNPRIMAESIPKVHREIRSM